MKVIAYQPKISKNSLEKNSTVLKPDVKGCLIHGCGAKACGVN